VTGRASIRAAALSFLVASAAAPRVAAGQAFDVAAIRPGQRHLLHVGAGVEDAAIVSLGYGYLVPSPLRTVALTTELDVVPVHPSDWRLRAGVAAPALAAAGRWGAGAKALGIARRAHDQVNTMTNAGVETSLTGGFYDARWFVAAEVGVDWAAATYIEHTARYRQTVYAGARDGWYASTGATVVYGLSGGYAFKNLDLVVRAGQRRDLHLDVWMVPFYAVVGVNVRFPFVP
jgi:hypothetical protein